MPDMGFYAGLAAPASGVQGAANAASAPVATALVASPPFMSGVFSGAVASVPAIVGALSVPVPLSGVVV